MAERREEERRRLLVGSEEDDRGMAADLRGRLQVTARHTDSNPSWRKRGGVIGIVDDHGRERWWQESIAILGIILNHPSSFLQFYSQSHLLIIDSIYKFSGLNRVGINLI